jgi:hypothetical protein
MKQLKFGLISDIIISKHDTQLAWFMSRSPQISTSQIRINFHVECIMAFRVCAKEFVTCLEYIW